MNRKKDFFDYNVQVAIAYALALIVFILLYVVFLR